MKKNKTLKTLVAVLLVLLTAVFLFSAYRVFSQLWQEKQAKEHYAALRTRIEDDEEDAEPAPAHTVLRKYRALYKQNPDLFGWIKIDGTTVDYPVMFTPAQPEYYLRRDFDKKYRVTGVPFLDGACLEDGNFYLVYGHYMRNKTMFGALLDYKDKAFWKSHSVIRFDTLYEKRKYKVMAAFYSKVYPTAYKTSFKYYLYHDLSQPEVFDEYVEKVGAAALYETGVEAAFGDELLALSTCSKHTADGRFVVVAKRIS